MKRVVVTSALVVGLLVAPGAAEAEATRIAVVGVEIASPHEPPGAPERMWVSDGILHIRDQPLVNVFTGTCGGDPCTFRVPFQLNVNVNLATGDGAVWGTWAYETDGVDFTWGERVGSIAGTFWGQSRGGFVTLKFIGHGTGDYAAMKLLGTADVPPPPSETQHPISAEILSPHS